MQSALESVVKTIGKPSVQHCQEGQHYRLESNYCECSYNCNLSWKITEVQKKLAAGNITLYSPPFYTRQNGGYKMCLFMYMDGDGSGKGTHLSFYIAVMKGDYDVQLAWPFQQKVTLVLEDQDHQQHIAKWFKPDHAEYNASFQRPSLHSEMNIAFGFPKFAPLQAVVDNSSYIKDDIMMLRCIIDTTGT